MLFLNHAAMNTSAVINEDSRVLFAGDPHGDFKPLIAAVHEKNPDAVVLLGDYDLDRPLEHYLQSIIDMTQIWWIPGNHDFDHQGRYSNLFHSALADFGLHLKVQDVAGFRIAGLGGIFLGRVWYPPNKPRWLSKRHYLNSQPPVSRNTGLSLKFKSAIWYDEVQCLKKMKADILVVHEAPGCHIYGFKAIDELAKVMGVKRIFHGHQHDSYSATVRHDIDVVGVADRSVVDLCGNQLACSE